MNRLSFVGRELQVACRRSALPVPLIDANLVLYAINQDAPQHELASQWLGA
jgi:hypothetical protein